MWILAVLLEPTSLFVTFLLLLLYCYEPNSSKISQRLSPVPFCLGVEGGMGYIPSFACQHCKRERTFRNKYFLLIIKLWLSSSKQKWLSVSPSYGRKDSLYALSFISSGPLSPLWGETYYHAIAKRKGAPRVNMLDLVNTLLESSFVSSDWLSATCHGCTPYPHGSQIPCTLRCIDKILWMKNCQTKRKIKA